MSHAVALPYPWRSNNPKSQSAYDIVFPLDEAEAEAAEALAMEEMGEKLATLSSPREAPSPGTKATAV